MPVNVLDDMLLLSELNEASILHNIRLRFNKDIIYVSFTSSYLQIII